MVLFFSSIFYGHFSLGSSSMLSVLFCLGCCRAPFSLLSATFLRFSPSCLSLVTVLILLLFSFLFCGYFFSLSSCSMLFVLLCLGCCRAPFSLLSATISCSFSRPSFTQPFYLVVVFWVVCWARMHSLNFFSSRLFSAQIHFISSLFLWPFFTQFLFDVVLFF